MRDLNLNELELVYGAGRRGRGCGNSPTPPSCWCDGRTKGTKKTKKTKKSKKSKQSKKSKRSKC